ELSQIIVKKFFDLVGHDLPRGFSVRNVVAWKLLLRKCVNCYVQNGADSSALLVVGRIVNDSNLSLDVAPSTMSAVGPVAHREIVAYRDVKSLAMADDTYTCRVQYVDDSDPFASTSNAFLEPMRPVTFAFRIHVTIADQLPEVIRTLRAPHKCEKFYFLTSFLSMG
ncbi:hypothetical protein NECAME_11260, partial [Necator americanus]